MTTDASRPLPVLSSEGLGPLEALRFFCSQHLPAQAWLDSEPLFADLARLVTQAIADERERCARVVRDMHDAWMQEYGRESAYNAGRCTALDNAERAIRGPNVGVEPPYSVGSND